MMQSLRQRAAALEADIAELSASVRSHSLRQRAAGLETEIAELSTSMPRGSTTSASPPPPMQRGHVYVALSKIQLVACDGTLGFAREQPHQVTLKTFSFWVMNGGFWDGSPTRTIMSQVLRSPDIELDRVLPNLSEHPDIGCVLNTPPTIGWPATEPASFSLTVRERTVQQLYDGVGIALTQMLANRRANGAVPLYGAARFTFAVTVIGGDTEAFQSNMGEVLERLLLALEGAAATLGCDVILVCYDPAHYHMAQSLRCRLTAEATEHGAASAEARWWPGLDADARAAAARLAARAQSGSLVVFAGAGASAGAGLPTWSGLLTQLARSVTPPLDTASTDWTSLDLLTQADILSKRCGGGGGGVDVGAGVDGVPRRAQWRRAIGSLALNQHVVAILQQYTRCSLVHVLLAGLPVGEYVTTNYDSLLEAALAAPKGASAPSVLPHAPRPQARVWVLKMHGCVSRPESIVLTRQDYVRYSEKAAALSGIVQACAPPPSHPRTHVRASTS